MPVLLSSMMLFGKVFLFHSTELGLFRNFRAIEKHHTRGSPIKPLPKRCCEKAHPVHRAA